MLSKSRLVIEMAIAPRVQGLKMSLNVLVKDVCESPHKGRSLCGEISAGAAFLNSKHYFPPKATVIHFYRPTLTVHHTKRGF